MISACCSDCRRQQFKRSANQLFIVSEQQRTNARLELLTQQGRALFGWFLLIVYAHNHAHEPSAKRSAKILHMRYEL